MNKSAMVQGVYEMALKSSVSSQIVSTAAAMAGGMVAGEVLFDNPIQGLMLGAGAAYGVHAYQWNKAGHNIASKTGASMVKMGADTWKTQVSPSDLAGELSSSVISNFKKSMSPVSGDQLAKLHNAGITGNNLNILNVKF